MRCWLPRPARATLCRPPSSGRNPLDVGDQLGGDTTPGLTATSPGRTFAGSAFAVPPGRSPHTVQVFRAAWRKVGTTTGRVTHHRWREGHREDAARHGAVLDTHGDDRLQQPSRRRPMPGMTQSVPPIRMSTGVLSSSCVSASRRMATAGGRVADIPVSCSTSAASSAGRGSNDSPGRIRCGASAVNAAPIVTGRPVMTRASSARSPGATPQASPRSGPAPRWRRRNRPTSPSTPPFSCAQSMLRLRDAHPHQPAAGRPDHRHHHQDHQRGRRPLTGSTVMTPTHRSDRYGWPVGGGGAPAAARIGQYDA